MELFKKQPRPAADNETFVRLIQVARENPAIRNRLKTILSLETFHRKSALNTFIEEMRLKGAPQEFVSAIACFLDNVVANKALRILKEENTET